MRQFPGGASNLTKAVLLIGMAALPASTSLAAEPGATAIPFRLHDHFIVLRGSIGPLDDLNLVVDTGATRTTVSREVAKSLGLKGRKSEALAYGSKVSVRHVTLPRLKIASTSFDKVTACVADLSRGPKRRSLRIDALIGLDFVRRTSLSIDFESRTLRFGAVEHSGAFVPFYPGLPFIVLRLEVCGEPVRLLLDTGARDLILFERRVDGRVRMKKTWERMGVRSLAGRAVLKKVHLATVTLGASSWDRLPAFLMGGNPPKCRIDGIVGPTALGLKELHVDFERNRIGWER